MMGGMQIFDDTRAGEARREVEGKSTGEGCATCQTQNVAVPLSQDRASWNARREIAGYDATGYLLAPALLPLAAETCKIAFFGPRLRTSSCLMCSSSSAGPYIPLGRKMSARVSRS